MNSMGPNVVKKQKKSQDLDPDFDPNSMVKGKASRRAPAKSSKNRKYKKPPPKDN